ncbi:MAG TPA: cupin domain-containing protein [Casimicrobiaceae bacterium]|nr:cupin domain-containing protein [Casimicrobiaceae bacterium]
MPAKAPASVVDLRAYATGAPPTRDWLTGRATPAFADDRARVVAFAPMGEGRVDALPGDEFVILLSGEVTLDSARGATVITAGRSAVLPAGLSFSWRAAAGTVAIVVTCPAETGAADRAVPIDETAPLQPSSPPIADLLVGPTPACRNHTDYRSNDGEFTCGTWDSTPYHRRAMVYRHIELMHLLEGSVTFEDASGSVTFREGDVFLAARGAECAWLSEVHVKKVYAIHRPA